jgi:hypothetical protein
MKLMREGKMEKLSFGDAMKDFENVDEEDV